MIIPCFSPRGRPGSHTDWPPHWFSAWCGLRLARRSGPLLSPPKILSSGIHNAHGLACCHPRDRHAHLRLLVRSQDATSRGFYVDCHARSDPRHRRWGMLSRPTRVDRDTAVCRACVRCGLARRVRHTCHHGQSAWVVRRLPSVYVLATAHVVYAHVTLPFGNPLGCRGKRPRLTGHRTLLSGVGWCFGDI